MGPDKADTLPGRRNWSKIRGHFVEVKLLGRKCVAFDIKEKGLFNQYINQTPFREFRDRFMFRLYKELEELYNSALVHNERREQFGIIERGG